MRVLCLAILVVLLMPFTAQAQDEDDRDSSIPSVPEEAAPAAAKALQTFSKLVTEQNYKQMGFESLEDVKAATLGVPAMEFFMRLDTLKSYQDGQPLTEVLSGGVRAVYPVLVREAPRSSFEIVKTAEGGWRAASFGGANFIQRLSRVREEKAKGLSKSLSEFFIVRVPALNLYFLGHDQNGEMMLTPITDDRRFEFVAGRSLLAAEVFRRMLPIAKATRDDLPG
jgi:hypothetical protein